MRSHSKNFMLGSSTSRSDEDEGTGGKRNARPLSGSSSRSASQAGSFYVGPTNSGGPMAVSSIAAPGPQLVHQPTMLPPLMDPPRLYPTYQHRGPRPESIAMGRGGHIEVAMGSDHHPLPNNFAELYGQIQEMDARLHQLEIIVYSGRPPGILGMSRSADSHQGEAVEDQVELLSRPKDGRTLQVPLSRSAASMLSLFRGVIWIASACRSWRSTPTHRPRR